MAFLPGDCSLSDILVLLRMRVEVVHEDDKMSASLSGR